MNIKRVHSQPGGFFDISDLEPGDCIEDGLGFPYLLLRKVADGYEAFNMADDAVEDFAFGTGVRLLRATVRIEQGD